VAVCDGSHQELPSNQAAPSRQPPHDLSTELEMAGATVLDLKPREWRDLALAA
jgi:hypothetical protein